MTGRDRCQVGRDVPPRLEVDHANQFLTDAKPVDGPGDNPSVLQRGGNRSFGQRVRAEQAGELRIANDPAGGLGDLFARI